MENNKYIVKYKNWSSRLNKNIIKNDEQLIELKKTYISMYKIFELMTNNIGNYYLLNELTIKLENIEYKLQKLYGFPLNKNHHRYWYTNNICTCPKIDNNEYLGTEYRLINEDCELHGKNMKTYLNRILILNKILKKYDNK
jgi:hypothetical protein